MVVAKHPSPEFLGCRTSQAIEDCAVASSCTRKILSSEKDRASLAERIFDSAREFLLLLLLACPLSQMGACTKRADAIPWNCTPVEAIIL